VKPQVKMRTTAKSNVSESWEAKHGQEKRSAQEMTRAPSGSCERDDEV